MGNSNATTPGLSHMKSLEIIRRCEIDIAIRYFPKVFHDGHCRILEVGAGTGHQAKYLSKLGYEVLAIDLPSSRYSSARVFPITNYDGENIPTNGECFDVVFSSNVLEHVVNIDKFLKDTHRVLKQGGLAIHIIPAPICRVWSIPAHYGWLARRIIARLKMAITKGKTDHFSGTAPKTPNQLHEWIGTFVPLRHGERGNTLSEVYYFSQPYWRRKFEMHGFHVKQVSKNGIFYTMANFMGSNLSLITRQRMARFLGSSCSIYVIEKHSNV